LLFRARVRLFQVLDFSIAPECSVVIFLETLRLSETSMLHRIPQKLSKCCSGLFRTVPAF
jgi:hypothetical protein